jgi:hypothetical protein
VVPEGANGELAPGEFLGQQGRDVARAAEQVPVVDVAASGHASSVVAYLVAL